MKRFLAAALITGLFSTCTLVGCSEETKEVSKDKISTPEGTKEIKVEKSVESTGDMKPSAEKPAEPPK